MKTKKEDDIKEMKCTIHNLLKIHRPSLLERVINILKGLGVAILILLLLWMFYGLALALINNPVSLLIISLFILTIIALMEK